MNGAKIMPWLGALTGAAFGGWFGSLTPITWLTITLFGGLGAFLGFVHGSAVRDDVLAKDARWAEFEKHLDTIEDPLKRFDEIMRYKW